MQRINITSVKSTAASYYIRVNSCNEGNNILKIWVTNNDMISSKVINHSFIVKVPHPSIYINNLSTNVLVRIWNRTVTVLYDASTVVEEEKSLHIQYSFDGLINTSVANISDYSQSHTAKVPVPSDIRNGQHFIVFVACDSNGRCSESNKVLFFFKEHPETKMNNIYQSNFYRRQRMSDKVG